MYSTTNGTFDRDAARVRVMMVAMLLGSVVLLGHLWNLQVRRAPEHRQRHERQSARRVRLPGQRGAIYDRRGRCLADNRPNYCLAVYVEELREPGPLNRTLDAVERTLDSLAILLGRERRVTRDDIRNHMRRRLALPLIAWQDLDEEMLARWAEHQERFPAVDLYVEPVRCYPQGPRAAHVLGYVGRRDGSGAGDGDYDFYLPEMEGRSGVELTFNEMLTGTTGGRLIRVDAAGFKHDERCEREPGVGLDLTLTLDAEIQRLAEQALEGVRGAVVVLDPRQGDVLALASSPAFDPNRFSPSIPPAEWQRLSLDADQPLFNRAVSGAYPPGSVFKLVVALAAVDSGLAAADTAFECPGYFALGPVRFRCWNTTGHGEIRFREALEQSCNVYFCQLGLRIGPDAISRAARSAGFGRPSGIELPAEAAGLVPDAAWKRRVLRDGWRSGDTCNLSIGQGALMTTPLQVAAFTAAIANGGRLYRPRLVLQSGPPPPPVAVLPWSDAALRLVRESMRDVVESPAGTGQRARIEGVPMAGKTGTAEYGRKDEQRRYAWMTVFAPYEEPRYVAVVVIEEAVSGGRTAAPRVRFLMQGLFGVGTPTLEEDSAS